MCMLFIFVDPCPKPGQYRMIIASNRDEYYNRPAQTVQEPSEDGIVGGNRLSLTLYNAFLYVFCSKSGSAVQIFIILVMLETLLAN